MKILDIGCGNNKYKSNNQKDKIIGLDIVKLAGVDVVHDLEKFPWPFKDDEFDLIIANHILEHLSDLIKTMEEIHRVGKPNSLLKVKVPYFAYPGAFQDPTHKRFFTLRTFEYFTDSSGLRYYSKARFEIIESKLNFSVTKPVKIIDILINKFPRFYERFLSRIIPAEELCITLKILKK
ncbi:MAG: class I SAM-dependent methyltransferase [Candidatus Pacearchaeota archaeon]